MKNYSSHNVSPDQVKEMISEVDKRQSEQIASLEKTNKILSIGGIIAVVALVLGVWCTVQIETVKKEAHSHQQVEIVGPVAPAASN